MTSKDTHTHAHAREKRAPADYDWFPSSDGSSSERSAKPQYLVLVSIKVDVIKI